MIPEQVWIEIFDYGTEQVVWTHYPGPGRRSRRIAAVDLSALGVSVQLQERLDAWQGEWESWLNYGPAGPGEEVVWRWEQERRQLAYELQNELGSYIDVLEPDRDGVRRPLRDIRGA
ncbi:hypothetical protein NUM3379_06630 [Kineococcus sp. NUM-3379]